MEQFEIFRSRQKNKIKYMYSIYIKQDPCSGGSLAYQFLQNKAFNNHWNRKLQLENNTESFGNDGVTKIPGVTRDGSAQITYF